MKHSHLGILVAIEGIDGAGKSTQVGLISRRLAAIGLPVVCSREPTDGPHGRRLRESALTGRLSAAEELETFIADRREHVMNVIRPALIEGKVVLLDRYYFSTAAYQGIRGLDWRAIVAQNEEFAPEPDILVILKVAAADGFSRVRVRDGRPNHFEAEGDLLRSDAIFDEVTAPYVLRLNGARDREIICAEIVDRIVRVGLDRLMAFSTDDRELLQSLKKRLTAWAASGLSTGTGVS